MACRLLFNQAFAREVDSALKAQAAVKVAPAKTAQPERALERAGASGLFVLSALQREGRLVDFLQQDVSGFSDEEVGAAARVVHAGCGKALKQYFEFEPAVTEAEGATAVVPVGFDAQRVRLTGNITGQPPFKGTVKHHGWVARNIRLPSLSESLDSKVIAPAEVELS
jgi:hypothetical protein